jgi:hypothetical protein
MYALFRAHSSITGYIGSCNGRATSALSAQTGNMYALFRAHSSITGYIGSCNVRATSALSGQTGNMFALFMAPQFHYRLHRFL